jgi:hypothetical protein
MQPPLISTWAVTPLDWIKIHPTSVPSSFLEAGILPQKINNGYGRLSRHISRENVRANGIPKVYMSSPR